VGAFLGILPHVADPLSMFAKCVAMGMFFYLYITFFLQFTEDIKRVISKRDGCVYLKQVPSIDGSLELV
jgi:hypothetical protein